MYFLGCFQKNTPEVITERVMLFYNEKISLDRENSNLDSDILQLYFTQKFTQLSVLKDYNIPQLCLSFQEKPNC